MGVDAPKHSRGGQRRETAVSVSNNTRWSQETIAKVLEDAAALVENGWCQGGYAQRRDGVRCLPHDPEAACFCPAGAVYRITGRTIGGTVSDGLNERIDLAETALDVLREEIRTVSVWNDREGRCKQDVVSALLRAAGRARRRERPE